MIDSHRDRPAVKDCRYDSGKEMNEEHLTNEYGRGNKKLYIK
jgi:hypothetical protein